MPEVAAPQRSTGTFPELKFIEPLQGFKILYEMYSHVLSIHSLFQSATWTLTHSKIYRLGIHTHGKEMEQRRICCNSE
jgi:hypothetical protein